MKRHALAVLVGLVALGVLPGCQGTGGHARPTHLVDDIVAIRTIYGMMPWLRDADGRINGFETRAYFIAADSGKGEFVPGTIHVTMSELERLDEGGYERHRMHEWALDAHDAHGFRLIKRSLLGDSYGLILKWPPSINAMGSTVEIIVYYERSDGRMINSPPRQLRVPIPAGFQKRSNIRRLETGTTGQSEERPRRFNMRRRSDQPQGERE